MVLLQRLTEKERNHSLVRLESALNRMSFGVVVLG